MEKTHGDVIAARVPPRTRTQTNTIRPKHRTRPMADPKRSALGKGLSALIPDAPEQRPAVTELDVDLLRPNQLQPRLRVDEARLEDLAASIKAHGVIQPIVVRRVDGAYEIVAGERR